MKSHIFDFWKDKIAWSTEEGQPYPCMSEKDFFKIIEQAEEKLINYIESMRDGLKSLAEDRTMPMDVKVHESLWQIVQSIDHDIKNKFKEVKADSSQA